jgi:hypothetical protein
VQGAELRIDLDMRVVLKVGSDPVGFKTWSPLVTWGFWSAITRRIRTR